MAIKLCSIEFSEQNLKYNKLIELLMSTVCKKEQDGTAMLATGLKFKATKLSLVQIWWDLNITPREIFCYSTLTGESDETIKALLEKMASRNGNDRIHMVFEHAK
jgi:hypothetical protein